MNERINDATGKRNLKERLLALFSSLMAIMAEQNNKMEKKTELQRIVYRDSCPSPFGESVTKYCRVSSL